MAAAAAYAPRWFLDRGGFHEQVSNRNPIGEGNVPVHQGGQDLVDVADPRPSPDRRFAADRRPRVGLGAAHLRNVLVRSLRIL